MKKNILMVIPHLTDGGAEKVLSELSFSLSENFNIYILLYHDRITYPFYGEKIIMENHIRITSSLFGTIRKALFLRRIKKDYNIDFCISFLVDPNLINVLSRKNEKVILTLHTNLTEYYKRKNWIDRLKNKIHISLFYNLSDNIVSVSNGVQSDLINNFWIKKSITKFIYNSFDINRILNKSCAVLSNDHIMIFSKPVIINIGRLSYSKGQWNLLRVFKEIKKHKDVNLVILGNGKYYGMYSKFIKDNKLEDSIYLLGHIENPYSYLKNSKVLISSSKFEGLSNVIIESLIIGTPVIATDCKSGPREIITCEVKEDKIQKAEKYPNGILLPYTHPEKIEFENALTLEENEMKEAILEVLDNQILCKNISENGKLRSIIFNSDNQINEWLKILN